MADTSDIRIGLIMRFKDDLYTVVDFQHVKPGKGGAFVRTTLKNLKSGRVIDNTFRSGEKIDPVRVERRKYQYLYRDSENLVCMDNETFDQINVAAEYFGGKDLFLKESEEIDILFDGDKILSVEIPIFVILKVVETEPGFRGDTATNVMKPAKLETGVTIQVPIFVDVDDVLKVDTRTSEYSERIKK